MQPAEHCVQCRLREQLLSPLCSDFQAILVMCNLVELLVVGRYSGRKFAKMSVPILPAILTNYR